MVKLRQRELWKRTGLEPKLDSKAHGPPKVTGSFSLGWPRPSQWVQWSSAEEIRALDEESVSGWIPGRDSCPDDLQMAHG